MLKSSHTICCRNDPIENPQIIKIEFPESLPPSSDIIFNPSIGAPTNSSIDIQNGFSISGIQGVDICAENSICAGNFLSPELTNDIFENFNLTNEVNLREMGGGQFRFGIVCTSGTIQEEYQVEISILEADGLPWHNKPEIRGKNKTQIYEGERGEILSLQFDSWDFLQGEMVVELETNPPNLKERLVIELQPNYLLPYARPGDVKFSQNAKLSLSSPVDPNEFGGEFVVTLRAKSWISNETLGVWSNDFKASVLVEDVDNLPPVFEDDSLEVTMRNEDFMDEEFVIFNASAVDGDRPGFRFCSLNVKKNAQIFKFFHFFFQIFHFSIFLFF